MKKREFLVPIITPFHTDGSVNYAALKKLVRHVLDSGADGIYAGGASSEFVLLTHEEREKILEAVIEAADGAYVAAHIGAASTAEAQSLARHAKKVGADCVASVPPFWYSYRYEEIRGYFTAIADASDLPVMIYNIPNASKVRFTKDEFCNLFSDERLFAVKYTDTDYYQMERIKTKSGAFIYSGVDECYLSALAAGADGAIGTTFNFMMQKYIGIRDAYRKGDNARALQIMTGANNITEAVIQKSCLPATKYLLTLQGIDAGECRKPFIPLSESEKDALKRVYENNI